MSRYQSVMEENRRILERPYSRRGVILSNNNNGNSSNNNQIRERIAEFNLDSNLSRSEDNDEIISPNQFLDFMGEY